MGMYPGELHRRHSVDLLDLCGKINSTMSVNSQVGTDLNCILAGTGQIGIPLL